MQGRGKSELDASTPWRRRYALFTAICRRRVDLTRLCDIFVLASRALVARWGERRSRSVEAAGIETKKSHYKCRLRYQCGCIISRLNSSVIFNILSKLAEQWRRGRREESDGMWLSGRSGWAAAMMERAHQIFALSRHGTILAVAALAGVTCAGSQSNSSNSRQWRHGSQRSVPRVHASWGMPAECQP
jgi:hypothetical protein